MLEMVHERENWKQGYTAEPQHLYVDVFFSKAITERSNLSEVGGVSRTEKSSIRYHVRIRLYRTIV